VSRDLLTIRTPEGIIFTLPLAGSGSRLLACAVDLGCMGVIESILAALLRAFGALSLDVSRALVLAALLTVPVVYGIATEWAWRGQTLGKRLLGLRVLDEQGLRLQPSQIVIRNLIRFVDALPALYMVGGAAMFLSRRAQRLGDLAARTVVVRAERGDLPDPALIASGRYNSMRDHPHLEARLRQRVTADEAALAVRALLRRDHLDPAARVELFRALAARFRRRADFPLEMVEAIPEEQFVRDVVDAVMRRGAAETSARSGTGP